MRNSPTNGPTGGAYAPRPIRCLELWQWGAWRLKVYGITHAPGGSLPDLVDAAKALATGILPTAASAGPRHYGVGFMGVHQGNGANLVFLDWWADENELYHLAYASTPDRPEALSCASVTGRIACVWDLAVMGFERQAWIDTVLSPPRPDVEAYLRARLNADV